MQQLPVRYGAVGAVFTLICPDAGHILTFMLETSKCLFVSVTVICALAGTPCCGAQSPSHGRPNILFIMIDDLGWMDIHAQGNDRFVTPNLDRLAAQGTRFTDFYAAAPVCSPTRAACITGLAPARVKVTNHIPDRWSFYDAQAPAGTKPGERRGRQWGPGRSRHVLDKEHQTIAQRLKAAGYHTAFIGKWHLAGPNSRTTDTALFPESYGFDVNIAGNAMGGPGTFYAPINMPNYKKGKQGEYLPNLLAQEAVDYIESVKDDPSPFFLCFWTYTVHWPIQATPELYAHYTDERNADGSVKEPDMPTRYRAMVEGMDIAVGQVLRALDEMRLSSNTLVVFTSDNGQMPGSSVADPLRAAKGYLYEGGIRVPMMMRWPGHIKAGAVDATPAISMDFAPTFLDAAGLDYAAQQFDGVSLLPVALGKGTLRRDALYWHYPHYCYHGANDMGSVVRCGNYKYIHHYDNHDHELFNLKTDIGETNNLYGTESAKAAELKAKLMAWLTATHAQLPRLYADIPAAELPGRKRSDREN
jgi:arylsulfatase A